MRTSAALLPLLGVLLALSSGAGCGRPGGRGLRVEVVLSSVDRPGPAGGHRLRSATTGETYPLVRVPKAGPGVYEAEDAPDGSYVLEADDGWVMIWPQRSPPELSRTSPDALAIQLGRPFSLYVGRRSPEYRFGTEWAAVEPGPLQSDPVGPPFEIPAKVDDLGVAVLRVPKERWHQRLVVMGRLEGGGVTRPALVDLKAQGRATLLLAVPADSLPLRLHVFGDDGAPLPDRAGGTPRPVRVRMPGLPLPLRYDTILRNGEAAFAALPHVGAPLLVSAEGAGLAQEFVLEAAAWRATQEVRLLAPSDAAEEVRLRVPDVPASLEIQARPAAGSSYGLVPFSRAGDAVTLRLPPGDVRLLLRADDRWAATRRPGPGAEAAVPFSEFLPATQVRAALLGVPDGSLRFSRVEDGRDVLAQGLVRSVRGEPEVVSLLPPGRYRVLWTSGAGTFGPPEPLDLEPGGQVRVALGR